MHLKHPLSVIQIIKKKLTYGKDLRAFDKRREAVNWPETMPSSNGCIRDNTLFITPPVEQEKNFSQANCLLLLDEFEINAENLTEGKTPSERPVSSTLLLSESKYPVKWDVFHFRCETGLLTTHFEWDYFKVGQPERDNHKLFVLQAHKTISFEVNGKIDATLSVGTRRHYQEIECTFIHHGQFNAYAYQTDTVQKPLAYTTDKRISLLKQLY